MDDLLLQFQASAPLLAITLFILGACIGSFINVVIYRLPPLLYYQWRQQCSELQGSPEEDKNQNLQSPPPNLWTPRSHCPKCLKPLKFFQNIPVFSYLVLGGKCGFCKTTISIRYPIVELLTAVLSVHLGLVFDPTAQLVFALVFVYFLIALSVIDFDHQILPDKIVLPLLWLGLLINCFGLFTDIKSAVIGAICGYLVLWIIYQSHHQLTGKEGMGYGDFKLLATIGAWLGWQMLPIIILMASIGGILVSATLIISNYQNKETPISFGPYLAIAAWAALIWGNTVMKNYLSVFSL